MITIILLAGMSCPATKIENHTKEWNKLDQATFARAEVRCGELYPEAPCLKLFRKKDKLTYQAVCGEKK